jgi:DoxX-like protein
MGTSNEQTTKTRMLWIAQGLLALIFLVAGGAKLMMPAQTLAQQSGLPGAFMQFIGVCEVLGALGLLLPGILKIQEQLTPVAASGLAVIMAGATVTTAASMPFAVVQAKAIAASRRGRRAGSTGASPRERCRIWAALRRS